MDTGILAHLIAQIIPPEQFHLDGLKVVFTDPERNNKPCTAPNESPYDTPGNRAIVEDVVKNYDTLAIAYEAEQAIARKRQAYRSEADPIYAEWQALLASDHPDAEARRLEWLAKRQEISER